MADCKRNANTHLQFVCIFIVFQLYLFAVWLHGFVFTLHFLGILCYGVENCGIQSTCGCAARLHFFVFRDHRFAVLGNGRL